MKLAAHASAQSFVDELVRGYPRFAGKGGRNHARGVVIAITGKVGYGDVRIGKGGPNERFDL